MLSLGGRKKQRKEESVLTKGRRSYWTQSASRLGWNEPADTNTLLVPPCWCQTWIIPLMPKTKKAYGRDGVRMSWQRFQTLPSFHIPYPHTLVELEGRETNTNHSLSSLPQRESRVTLPVEVRHLFSILLTADTHRSWHDQIRLGVEVAAEDVVAVSF